MRSLKFRIYQHEKINYTVDLPFNENVDINGQLDEIAERCIIMQFTGLKDKNGKDIYEGDILREPNFDPYFHKNFNAFEVFWHDNDSCNNHVGWQMNRMHTQGNSAGGIYLFNMKPKHTAKLEIIGNIYENPNLLK